MVSTTNYGFYQPLVNNASDEDVWGSELNTDLSEIDTVLYTAMNLTASAQTTTITVTAPTAGSTTTGSSNMLYLCNATSGAFAANLPAASTATNMVVAFKKTDSSGNAITITGHSTDKIDGSGTFVLSAQYQYVVLECDGSEWNIISQTAAAQAQYVTAVGYGIQNNNGTISLNPTVITQTLAGDVGMTNANTYYDGPSIAQGTSGTWCVTGYVTVYGGLGAHGDVIDAKLWDGTTVFASVQWGQTSTVTYNTETVHLSAIVASPAGNIKISVNNTTSGGGTIKANASGNGKDSQIQAFRLL